MFQNWQDIPALGLVLLASLYLAWRGLRLARSRGRCGGCSNCGDKKTEGKGGELPLVEISPPGKASTPPGRRS